MLTQPFGAVVAESERSADSGHLFISDTSDRRVEAVLASSCCIVLGQRGTGKTALAQYLEYLVPRTFSGYASIDLPGVFSQVKSEVERAIDRGVEPLLEDVARIWEVVLWTVVMVELERGGQLSSRAVGTYLSTTFPAGPNTFIGTVLETIVAAIRSEQGSLLDRDGIQQVLRHHAFPNAVEVARDHLNQRGKIVVVIDSLDDNPVKTKAGVVTTIGLLAAVNRAADKLHRNIHVKCFVATELWRHVSRLMPNVGKFDPFEIRWAPDDLVRLVCFRLNQYLNEMASRFAVDSRTVMWESPSDIRSRVWARFFPPMAMAPDGLFFENTEMLLMRHTQLRPRHLIVLCNSIAQNWTTGQFTPIQIKNGIDERIDTLASEVIASYQNIHDDADSLLDHFAEGPAVRDASAMAISKDAWDTVYKIGAVGPVRAQEHPFPGAEFPYYQSSEFAFCRPEPIAWTPRRELVAVHPIFHKRLGIHEDMTTMVGLRGWWSRAQTFAPNRFD